MGAFFFEQNCADIATTEPERDAIDQMHSRKEQELDKSMFSQALGIDSLIAMSFPTTITTDESSSAHAGCFFLD